MIRRPSKRELRGFAWGLVATTTSTLLSFAVQPFGAHLTDMMMIHLLGVVLVAMRYSLGVSLLTAFMAVASFDYFFIPPVFQFALPDLKYIITFVAMIVIAGVISMLNERLRREQAAARRSEAATMTLYRLSQDLASVARLDQLLAVGARQIEHTFAAEARVLLWDAADAPDPHDRIDLSAEELTMARRAWTHCERVLDRRAGRARLWQPLIGSHRPVGVLGLRFTEGRELPDQDDLRVLEGCAAQLAGAIERISLGTAVQSARLEVETERLRNALLSTVSHDLKTPLAAIIAAGSTLGTNHATLDAATRAELTGTIVESAERLDAVITNLLSATRLESGIIQLTFSMESLEELIGAALSHFSDRLGDRPVHIDVPSHLPLVRVDAQLIELVLSNLLENALRYTPENTALHISAGTSEDGAFVRLADEGPGILADEQEKVFEKFYRGSVARKNDGGAGLGLMICRAALRAHGGRILARERAGGGASLEFFLPTVAERAPALGLEPEGPRPQPRLLTKDQISA